MAMAATAVTRMAAVSMAAANPAQRVQGLGNKQALAMAMFAPQTTARFSGIAKMTPQARRFTTMAQAAEADEGIAEDFEESGFAPAQTRGNKLYVGNLPWSVDSQTLAETFEQCGTVDTVEVIYDKETGRSRGFAFVTFESADEAARAVEELDGVSVGGRALRVNFPNPPGAQRERSERPPRREGGAAGGRSRDSPNKLYVGNLSWGMDDLGLEDLFSEYGKVVEAKVITDRDTGRSRGFGFVTMSNTNEVNEAIAALDGVDVDGRTIRVNLSSSKPSGGGGGYGGGRGGDSYGRGGGYGGDDGFGDY